MIEKQEKIKALLKEEWEKLNTAMEGLQQSLEKCEKIGIKASYSFEEMEAFDSLSSKFARNSDILFQKIFKSIMFLLGENALTFIDRVHVLHKLNLIEDAEMIKEIRDFRNQIVHEYFPDQIISLYPYFIDYSKKLITVFESTKNYLLKKEWIN